MTNHECDRYTRADRDAALYWATRTAVAAFIDDSTPHHDEPRSGRPRTSSR